MPDMERPRCPNCGHRASDDTSVRQLATGSCFECDRCGFRLDPWGESRLHH